MNLPDVLTLAQSLMDRHGVGDWEVGFDRARRRAGQADHRARRITLSRHLMALYDEDDVRETVLHEIAHARVGAKHGHDAVWQAEARRIGSRGERLVSRDAPQIEGRWVGTCPSGHTVNRMRRPASPLSCARCSPRFTLSTLLEWSLDGVPVPHEQISARYWELLSAACQAQSATPPTSSQRNRGGPDTWEEPITPPASCQSDGDGWSTNS